MFFESMTSRLANRKLVVINFLSTLHSFCLEYNFRPFEIEYDLRIYQLDEVIPIEVDPTTVVNIMNTIQRFDERLNEMKAEL